MSGRRGALIGVACAVLVMGMSAAAFGVLCIGKGCCE